MAGPEPSPGPPAWQVVEVAEADRLVAASDLFDSPVTTRGAAQFLARPGHVALLAVENGCRAVGFITGVEMFHPDKGAEMFVYELGVDAAWRRQGVARALVDALVEVARARGCYSVWTATERDNAAALATYRAAGAELDPEVVIATVTLPAAGNPGKAE